MKKSKPMDFDYELLNLWIDANMRELYTTNLVQLTWEARC